MDAAVEVGRAALVVAYDGSGFHGFAENPGVRTVMGELRAAVERIVGRTVVLTGAGRTDAGVHAWGQVVSGDLPAAIDLADLAHRLNRICGPQIAVRAARWEAPDFDARFSAVWRHYRYTVVNTPFPHPLRAATAWHVPQPLALPAMRLACDALIGEHDFSSFCRAPKPRAGDPSPSLVRRVAFARWSDRRDCAEDEGLITFEIRANAFCHQMVRSIVGTLVDVGIGRIRAGEVRSILLRRDRAAAGQVAPPHGLCLSMVGYGGNEATG